MANESDTQHAPGTTATKSGDDHTTQMSPADHAQHPAADHQKKEMHTSTEAHGGAHNDVGFPPFNAETFAPQLIWLALTFTVLYLILSRIALPRIGEIIEEREDRIQRDLETAERLKSETENALNAYEKALADARSNASEIAKETREKLSGEVDIERKRVDAEINAKVADAETRIAETQQKALASVNEIAGDVAKSLVSKLTGTDVSADEIQAALKAASANS